MNENRSIARQRGGIARHINDAARTVIRDGFDQFNRALARRIDEHLVEMAQCGQGLRRRVEKVGNPIVDLSVQPILCGILRRPTHQLYAAFDTDHVGTRPGDRQGEITQATKHVGNALAGPRVEQGHGASYQDAIDRMVDLSKFGWRKIVFDIVIGQAIRQTTFIQGVKPIGRGRALGLQIENDSVSIGKFTQQVLIGGGQRLQNAKHQRRDGFADSYLGLIVVHAALGAPFVLTTVLATLQGFNHNLVRASLSLGAGPVETFVRITLPVIAPGVISGALFAFATSFDEVVVTLFLAGPEQVTLPRQMFTGIRENISPTIAAVATLLTIFTTGLMLALEWIRGRRA